MSLKLISKYRNQLMAIAMLWLAIYHSYFPIPSKIIAFTCAVCGHGGVDVFMFLSSFGLYYAYKKNNNYKAFIKRRFLRIYPYYIPVCLVLMLYHHRGIIETVLDMIGLSIFFRSDLTLWYTSLTLVLYVLAPLYLKIFNKHPHFSTITVIAIVTLACIISNNVTFEYIYFRVAVFALGFWFAYKNDHGDLSRIKCWLIVLIGIFGWFVMYYCYHHFGNGRTYVMPFILITPGMCLLISYVLDKIKVLNKPLALIAPYTYQFYLIHLELINFLYTKYEILFIPNAHFDYLINFAGIILALIASVIYKKLIDLVIESFRRRKEGI